MRKTGIGRLTGKTQRSGLRKIRIHELRHSYASLVIQATKNLHYAKEQLGHSSIKVTVDIYGHLLKPQGDEREVDILDKLAIVGLEKCN